jgi:hypothetical protein
VCQLRSIRLMTAASFRPAGRSTTCEIECAHAHIIGNPADRNSMDPAGRQRCRESVRPFLGDGLANNYSGSDVSGWTTMQCTADVCLTSCQSRETS